jgi:hypothetical protein
MDTMWQWFSNSFGKAFGSRVKRRRPIRRLKLLPLNMACRDSGSVAIFPIGTKLQVPAEPTLLQTDCLRRESGSISKCIR